MGKGPNLGRCLSSQGRFGDWWQKDRQANADSALRRAIAEEAGLSTAFVDNDWRILDESHQSRLYYAAKRYLELEKFGRLWGRRTDKWRLGILNLIKGHQLYDWTWDRYTTDQRHMILGAYKKYRKSRAGVRWSAV